MLIIIALLTGAAELPAQSRKFDEHSVKAGFLFNFFKFVEWPAEAHSDDSAPLVIGIVGEDPFAGALDQAVSGKQINGRQLIVKRLKCGPELRSCHILFISSSERRHFAQIFEVLRGASVLTVGDTNQFSQQGGIINLIREANKVRFEINAGVAERSRLKISSKLLALAKTVIH